ncbi:Rho GTPase activation protein [Mytilinidion resinicola]|uniref:Rho GTPase activation protein n=1 Tax=Mytilinidion resinicola TaxID=574789 RepID=A0A6A6YMF5_9PEZI|nr:Rho GTPase activation protein [Mytilinidion resinicola]KAF2809763.1 Rho GTPase activation protein [Mytilinidion resinicola]
MPVVSSASEASDLNVNLIEPKSKKKTNRLLRLFSPKARDEKPKVPRESLSSASVSTQKTPETPRRDLTQWWEGFKRSSDANTPTSGRTAQRVFGVSLNTMIPYANVAISLVDEDGKSYIYGYVPIVVAKCGVFLKEKGTEVEGLFVTPGSPQRIAELKDIFDTPDRYGKGLDWVGYTLHDAAGVFMLFLASLPEPVIPCELYQAFRAVDIYEKEGIAKLVKEYQSLIKLLPPLNRQLLLYLLDCFAVFASKSELNKATSDVLASIFHTSILRRSNDFDHDVNPEFLIFSKETLVFLIENQDHFLIGMESSSDTVEDSGTTTNEVPD